MESGEDNVATEGELGGDFSCGWTILGSSTKKECDISLEMQSRLAIISFSFLVSQASFRGSNISLGLSPPFPFCSISKARSALFLRGGDRFASREVAIVSRAEEIRTTERVVPWDIVRERLCNEVLLDKDAERGVGVLTDFAESGGSVTREMLPDAS
jgi:hypothetical protein